MVGSVAIIILLAAVVPVAIIMSGLGGAALLGMLLKNDVDKQHAGSELLELSERG